MKKRMLIMILAGVMVVTVGLAGCGKSDSKKDNSDSDEEIKVEESSEESSEEDEISKEDIEAIKEAKSKMTDEEWNAVVDQAVDKAFAEVGAGSSDSSEESSSSESSGSTYEDRTLTTNDCIIKITDYKIAQPEEKGNEFSKAPVIVFWYDLTNTSGKDMDSSEWIYYFDAYQDNDPNYENELEMGMYTDEDLSDLQYQNIKQGGTIQSYASYELSDDTTPVTLKVRGEHYGDVIASEDFPIN